VSESAWEELAGLLGRRRELSRAGDSVIAALLAREDLILVVAAICLYQRINSVPVAPGGIRGPCTAPE
jgi:hypothetical protein